MALRYGFLRCTITSPPHVKASRRKCETQYHLHANLDVDGQRWDCAVNVGTNDSDDLLNFRLVYDFHHPIVETLRNVAQGFRDLTATRALPALDIERSDILAETAPGASVTSSTAATPRSRWQV